MAEVILNEKEMERKIQLILPENLWNIIENYNEYSLEKTLKKQTGAVGCICMDLSKQNNFNQKRNKKQIITCGNDNNIGIWNLETRKFNLPVKILKGHFYTVGCVCIYQNRKQIIPGSNNKTIEIWDSGTGKFNQPLKGYEYCVRSVCVTPNGKQIISESNDKTIKIWDLKSGNCEKTLRDYSDTDLINSVCLTPNKRSDFSRRRIGKPYRTLPLPESSDNTIRIWTQKIFNN